MSASVWRIASDTPNWTADDLKGEGAKRTGGRWNRQGLPTIYASSTRALACLETLVHIDSGGLPFNRYLVEIIVPETEWGERELFDADAHTGWDATPPGRVSIDWGTAWLRRKVSLIAEVPSIVVPEEPNVLINPLHPAASNLRSSKIRKWTYDPRL